jgi:mRNA interferase RelE/StbE
VAGNRFEVRLTPGAERQLAGLARPAQVRIARTIDHFAASPRPKGAKLLTGDGSQRIWRVRVGDYRIVYQIHDDRLVVLVIAVGHRRDVYRRGR